MWFVGFSPDLAVGVFLGYDQPKSLGNAATAGQYAAPVFRDFMQMALKDKPATPFRVPAGIKLIRVSASSGTARRRARAGARSSKPSSPAQAPPEYVPPEPADEGPQAEYSPAPPPGAQRAVGVGPADCIDRLRSHSENASRTTENGLFLDCSVGDNSLGLMRELLYIARCSLWVRSERYAIHELNIGSFPKVHSAFRPDVLRRRNHTYGQQRIPCAPKSNIS